MDLSQIFIATLFMIAKKHIQSKWINKLCYAAYSHNRILGGGQNKVWRHAVTQVNPRTLRWVKDVRDVVGPQSFETPEKIYVIYNNSRLMVV